MIDSLVMAKFNPVRRIRQLNLLDGSVSPSTLRHLDISTFRHFDTSTSSVRRKLNATPAQTLGFTRVPCGHFFSSGLGFKSFVAWQTRFAGLMDEYFAIGKHIITKSVVGRRNNFVSQFGIRKLGSGRKLRLRFGRFFLLRHRCMANKQQKKQVQIGSWVYFHLKLFSFLLSQQRLEKITRQFSGGSV
jgi:hypothetical protein